MYIYICVCILLLFEPLDPKFFDFLVNFIIQEAVKAGYDATLARGEDSFNVKPDDLCKLVVAYLSGLLKDQECGVMNAK